MITHFHNGSNWIRAKVSKDNLPFPLFYVGESVKIKGSGHVWKVNNIYFEDSETEEDWKPGFSGIVYKVKRELKNKLFLKKI